MSALAKSEGGSFRVDEIFSTSQDGLRAVLASRGGPILAGVWRPWCFMAGLVWPVLRQAAELRSGLVLLNVKLEERELPEPGFRIRWLPATVLFYQGRARTRWYGGDLDASAIARSIDQLRAEPSA